MFAARSGEMAALDVLKKWPNMFQKDSSAPTIDVSLELRGRDLHLAHASIEYSFLDLVPITPQFYK